MKIIRITKKEFKKEIIKPFLEEMIGDENFHCQECGIGYPEADEFLFDLFDKLIIKKGYISL